MRRQPSRRTWPTTPQLADGFLEGPQHGVHPGLIAGALRFEPSQYVGYEFESLSANREAGTYGLRSRCVSNKKVARVVAAPTASLACRGCMPLTRPARP